MISNVYNVAFLICLNLKIENRSNKIQNRILYAEFHRFTDLWWLMRSQYCWQQFQRKKKKLQTNQRMEIAQMKCVVNVPESSNWVLVEIKKFSF